MCVTCMIPTATCGYMQYIVDYLHVLKCRLPAEIGHLRKLEKLFLQKNLLETLPNVLIQCDIASYIAIATFIHSNRVLGFVGVLLF